jgi:hypothetical protein
MILKISLLLVALLATSTFAQNKSSAPPGWGRTGSNPGGYDFAIDTSQKHSGNASALIRPKPTAVKDKFGGLIQTIRPDNYRGKRIRLSGYLKTENVGEQTSLWIRIDGPKMEMLDFSNMDDRPITGTTGWQKYELVVDVPDNAEAVVFGAFQVGATGQSWIDDLKLETVSKDVTKTSNPISEADRREQEEYLKQIPKEELGKTLALYRSSPVQPINLDFEQADVSTKAAAKKP